MKIIFIIIKDLCVTNNLLQHIFKSFPAPPDGGTKRMKSIISECVPI